MKCRHFLYGLVLFAGFAVATQALAQQREYRLMHYPVALSECLGVASEVAERFTISTGIDVERIRCEPVSLQLSHLVLHYEAETKPNLVTTDDSGFVWDAGIYSDRGSCERTLQSESLQFAEHTGLDPVVAYCRQDSTQRYNAPSRWLPRIDAFGAPELSPLTSWFSRFSTPIAMSDQQWAQGLISSMRDAGYIVRVLTFRNEIVSRFVTVRYYGNQPIRFVESTLVATGSSRACLSQQAMADEIVTELGYESFSLYCSQNSRGSIELTMLANEAAGRVNLPTLVALESFTSESSCLAEIPELISQYSELTGLDIIGGLCDFRGRRGGVEAHLYYREH